MLARRIKPLFDRVLIKRVAAPKQTAGGLYLPESAQNNDIPQVCILIHLIQCNLNA